MTPIKVVLLLWFASPAQAADPEAQALGRLGQGHAAYRAGSYRAAVEAFAGLETRLPQVSDHVLYFRAESDFFAGFPSKARDGFVALGKKVGSRFAAVAPWRAADATWALGDRAAAAAAYARLLGKISSRAPAPKGVDPVPARFRMAQMAALRGSSAEANRLWRQITVDHPSHPLATLAADLVGRPGPAVEPHPVSGPRPVSPSLTPRDRLRRAEVLVGERDFAGAVLELEAVVEPLDLGLRAERDFALGMAKYRMRRDYAGAAALLLGAVDGLLGDKAAQAAFHGARALSRADRDDEAIVAYGRMISRFPQARFAPEAQFLSGWLNTNRGRFREGLTGLQGTVARYPKSSFAEDAAWFIALSYVLLNEPENALGALDRYVVIAARGPDQIEAGRKAGYFKGRSLQRLQRRAEAVAAYRDLAQGAPFSYYGLLAAARLRELGESVPLHLPSSVAPRLVAPKADAMLGRADTLLAAGLDVEAGAELERVQAALVKHPGAMAALFDRAPRMVAYGRAYKVAEVHGGPALRSMPTGDARLWWQAAYPRAYADLVEPAAQAAELPDLFLFSIMRKESGFGPNEVSYADARGLLQMMPETTRGVAAGRGEPFFDDELYVPAINIRFGAIYIGKLWQRFGGSPLVTAGAYNAGAQAMARWCQKNGERPVDEFVELVTFEQSREYIKRVAAIFARYRFLYGAEVWQLGLSPGCVDKGS